MTVEHADRPGLRALGREVARGLPVDPDALARARARALAGRGADVLRARSRPRPLPIAAAAVVALVAAIALVVTRRAAPSSLRAEVEHGGRREPIAAGAWLSADERAVPVTFSDGTRWDLAPGGRARLSAVDARGADVTLERGRIHGKVVHTTAARWRVAAGPFEVEVTGTELEVDWDPEAASLRVRLASGSVNVRGCRITADRRVAAGEELHVECMRVEVAPSASQAPTAAPSASATASSASPRPAASVEGGADWRALARERRHDEAVRAAEAEGLRAVCARGSGDDLDALSDAARLARRSDVAVQILECERGRFPGTERAATAAFELGRVAFDSGADYPKARTWFEIYLRERPQGRLAREALGRAMEAASRAGEQDRARDLATRYLHDHPTGPHAAAARGIAGAGEGP